MENAITSAEQLTPERLTAILREQGVLPQGEATGVTHGEAQSTFASAVWRLRVDHSPQAPPDAPTRLFLKTSHPTLAPGEFDPEGLRKEVVFYRTIAPAMDESPAIPCYDAVYEPETGASHVLLLDVSETHAVCHTPTCERNCEQAVESLARLHAFWWDHQRLGQDVGRILTQKEHEEDWADAGEKTAAFMAALDDRLRGSWRAAYERVLPVLPGLFERHASGRNLTLAHGDAHLGNFLFPVGEAGKTYIVDWQFWHVTIGGTDLAFMIATDWETETRRRLEQSLLRRYYRTLETHGVQGYSWDDCWNDYRLSAILVSIFIPVWRWALFGWEADVTTLERMTAFEDSGCSDLL